MEGKTVSKIMLTMLLIGMLTLAFNIPPAKASGIPPDLTVFDPEIDGLSVSINGVVFPGTPGTSITRIHWDWGDENEEDHWFPAFHTFSSYGDYTITVTAYQSDGLTSTKTKHISLICALYIRADGSVDPPTAPIQRDGNVYTFTDNIYGKIVVERDDIVVDGAGYTLEGTGSGYGIDLTGRSNVIIKNMKIKSFSVSCGIWIGYGASNNIIFGNNIKNNWNGIGIYHSSNYNIISGNDITDNINRGITLYGSSNYNTISGNNIKNNYKGISLYSSSNNIVHHNNFVDNSEQVYSEDSTNVWDDGYPSGGNYWSDYTGVDFYSGPYQDETGSDGIGDTLYVIDEDNQDNYPFMNPWGPVHNINTNLNYWTIQEAIDAPVTLDGHTIRVDAGTYYEHVTIDKSLTLIGENARTTIIDGSEIGNVIMVNADGVYISVFTIRNSGPGPEFNSGVYLFNVQSCIITNNIVSNNRWGITLHESSRNQITNNDVSSINPATGIVVLFSSFENLITRNTITQQNGFYGIYLQTTCNNNIISYNLISCPPSEGIVLHDSHNNRIINNEISSSQKGLRLTVSNENWVYHNNFIDNTIQACDDGVGNHWDDGYPSGGNYWSDHIMVDDYSGTNQDELGSDGIVDEPYIIDDFNRDNYPLAEPWSHAREALEKLIRAVESWNLDTGIENSLTSKLKAACRSLDRENEKASLGQLTAFINEAKALKEKKLTGIQADYLISEAQRIIDLIKG